MTTPLKYAPLLLAALAAACSAGPSGDATPPPAAEAATAATATAAATSEQAQTAQVSTTTVIPLKPEAVDGFLETMLANARHARGEDGDISFDVFRPEDGSPKLVLFERWRDRAALEAHWQQPTLKAVQAAIPEATSAAPTDTFLSEVPPSGADSRRAPADPANSRNVLVFLKIKPDQEQTFLDGFAEVIPQARAAPGNAVFELYRDTAQAHSYVLLERWDSVEAHEAHLAQPYSQKLDGIVPATLAAPIVDGESRFLLRDVGA